MVRQRGGGRLRLKPVVTEPDDIERILGHARAPPRMPFPGQPAFEFCAA